MKTTSRFFGLALVCIISANTLPLNAVDHRQNSGEHPIAAWFKKPSVKTSIAILGAIATVATILLLANNSKKRGSAESNMSYGPIGNFGFTEDESNSSSSQEARYFEPHETKRMDREAL